MTSTKPGSHVGGYRREVDYQKLGPALIIASSLVLAIRTTRWDPTHSDGVANVEWEKEVEHTPAISIPMPISSGLPLGLQLTAGHGQDARVLRTAVRLQQMIGSGSG